jgi:hypothetical protein
MLALTECSHSSRVDSHHAHAAGAHPPSPKSSSRH